MATAKLTVPILVDWDDIKDHMAKSDIMEVVRCKDCKCRDAETGFCEGRGWPMQLVPDDGFCDKGERRDDGKG